MTTSSGITWQTEKRKIKDLIPFENNPRKMDEKQEKDLKKSLEKFNLVEIPAINLDGKIIAGHQRLRIMGLLGRKNQEIDVRVPSRLLTEEEFREYNLRSNKNTGAWDWSALADFDDIVLKDVGFSSEEIDKIFDQKVEEDEFDADAEAASIITPITQAGDLYILGEHKLLCGDSTKRENYERLFGDERARMVFTDPPYNIGYDYTKLKGEINGTKWKKGNKVFDDEKSPEEFCSFLQSVFKNCFDFTGDDASIYVSYGMKFSEQFFEAFKKAGWYFAHLIMWLKERIYPTPGEDWWRIFEPIMFGWKADQAHYKNLFTMPESDVWDLDKKNFEERLNIWYERRDKSADYEHPTQKPVRLPERAIKKNSERGDIVLEPFGGSGSTLLACEQLKRNCYSIELDPKYADVIVRRWERFTGQKAERVPFLPIKPL